MIYAKKWVGKFLAHRKKVTEVLADIAKWIHGLTH